MFCQNCTNFSQNETAISRTQTAVYGTIANGIISLGAIFSNLLLLYILNVRIKTKLFSNHLFSSLALSDFLIGLVVIPLERSIVLFVKDYQTNNSLQAAISWTTYSQTSISLYVLVFLTLHRLQLITRPLKTSERVSRLRLAILVGVWLAVYIYIGILCLHIVYIAELSKLVGFIFIILASVLPMVLIVIFNTWTIIALRLKAKKNQAAHLKSKKSASYKRDAKAIKCLVLIMFIKFVSQGFMFFVLIIFIAEAQLDLYVVLVAQILSYANAFLDPLVVFMFHEIVRVESLKLFSEIRAYFHNLT